ncbi:hypothetical protein QCA50_008693 [Cerrena zonata]|uniref:Uncharacterized protein n=1 Tax=Cerrena zonata TaxID=2478898 RepID=A0AAW0GFR2_9APHY
MIQSRYRRPDYKDNHLSGSDLSIGITRTILWDQFSHRFPWPWPGLHLKTQRCGYRPELEEPEDGIEEREQIP